jgi:hypothetical protein
MNRRFPIAVACAASLLLPAATLAQTPAGVDRVLSALAEVIQDRAKRVAGNTVARQLKDKVCSQKLTLNRKSKPALELRVGGADCLSRTIMDDWVTGPTTTQRWCNSDDVLVQTCRLAGESASDLTDPYFLKSLTGDVIALLVRVSATHLDVGEYEDMGFPAFATYLHRVLEVASAQPRTTRPFAAPTFMLADALSPGLEKTVMATLGNSAAARTLLAELGTKLPATCAASSTEMECVSLRAVPAVWYPDLTHEDARPRTCDDWFAEASTRYGVFDALFTVSTSKLQPVMNKACSSLPPGGPERKDLVRRCERGQLLVNLTDLLLKAACIERSPDARRDFRELRHVLASRDRFADSLLSIGIARKNLDDFASDFASVSFKALPRQTLSYGIRMLAALLDSYATDADATKLWLRTLVLDARSAVSNTGDPFTGLVEGAALARPARKSLATPELIVLRDSVADLVALPGLYSLREGEVAKTLRIRRELLALLDRLSVLASEEPSFNGGVYLVAEYLDGVASLTRLVDPVSGSTPAAALVSLSNGLRAASKGDWVGLGGMLVDELNSRNAGSAAASRPIAFARVLLAMYQAPSVPEAKKVFEASLEDINSREKRWDSRFTIDVAALVGARGGAWQQTASLGSHDPGGLYGMFAPFGAQLAWKEFLWLFHGGLLVYPLDLGTYLTGQSKTDTPVKWSDAVRLGTAVYARPSDKIPIVFGAGADFQPEIERPANARAYAFIGLELPLMVMY